MLVYEVVKRLVEESDGAKVGNETAGQGVGKRKALMAQGRPELRRKVEKTRNGKGREERKMSC